MSPRDITPIGQMRRRMPEQGRIRIGKQVAAKSGKMRPDKLSTFRFTSPDRAAIEQLAEAYGGKARPWDDPTHKNQWEVETLTTELPVILPPDCLGDTPIYELWNAGGLLRRCDGLTCEEPKPDGPDGYMMMPTMCICRENNTQDCKAKLRLQVILRDVRFGGAWLLTSSGWNAAQELPGMVDMIYAMQDKGLPLALLRLVERSTVRLGKTKHYNVPVLAVDASVNQIAAGHNVLTGGEHRAMNAPAPKAIDIGNPDDEPVEGELVLDVDGLMVLADQVATRWNELHKVGQTTGTQLLGILAMQITGEESYTVNQLSGEQGSKIATVLEEILDGATELTAIENRKIKIRRL